MKTIFFLSNEMHIAKYQQREFMRTNNSSKWERIPGRPNEFYSIYKNQTTILKLLSNVDSRQLQGCRNFVIKRVGHWWELPNRFLDEVADIERLEMLRQRQ